MLIDELAHIVGGDRNQFAEKLRAASLQAKEVFYFCYSKMPLDLPEFSDEEIAEIYPDRNPRSDCLKQEVPKFLRYFVRDFNPRLDQVHRVRIFKEILARVSMNERGLLMNIVRRRCIGWIQKSDVEKALGREFLVWRTPNPPDAAPTLAYDFKSTTPIASPKTAFQKAREEERARELEMAESLKSIGNPGW
jgi:hypothetical protein